MRNYYWVWLSGEVPFMLTRTYWGAVDFVKKYADENGYKNLSAARVEFHKL